MFASNDPHSPWTRGPKYDPAIERFYTETSAKDIFRVSAASILDGQAIGDTKPLRRIIERELTDDLVAQIAREDRRGRKLMIGTTNLDAQRPVIWDIGRIARSGNPGARELIANILLASASIPGVFPPVAFDVVIDGKRYQELHGDGGVTHEIFVYPPAVNVGELQRKTGRNPPKNFWLIRNTKIHPEYEPVKARVPALAGRAISTLIKYQGRGDLIALERLAHRDGFKFHLTYVPQTFKADSDGLFDPKYMRALFEVGYDKALGSRPWAHSLADIAAGRD